VDFAVGLANVGLKFVRPTSHVEAFLDELSNNIKNAPPDPPFWKRSPYAIGYEAGDALLAPVALAEGVAIAAAQDGIDAVKHQLGKKARAKALEKRRTYYAKDAVARQAQREIIAKARPTPEHPCPSPAELIEAYVRRHESEEWKMRFGTLMIDLEEHVRRTYIHAGNKFTGSSGGVKDWLERECPDLARHYSTCQRFKRKLQDIPDPDSCSATPS